MALLRIPTRSDLDLYNFETTIEGVTYQFFIAWNTRLELWFLSIADSEGNDLISGIPLVQGISLLERFGSESLPPGILFVHHLDGKDPYDKQDFGNRLLLLYQETEG